MTNTRTEVNVATGEIIVTTLTQEETIASQTGAPSIYAILRAEAYPPITEYLDGIVKGDAEQVAKYVADCLAVKALYPKE